MTRKFAALLVLIAATIAIGGMACVDTVNDLDKSDETDGAT
jgi:hypothetical protein